MELPNRKLVRLHDWNYSENGYYFITICTKDRQNLLGRIVGNGFIRSAVGTIVEEQLCSLSNRYGHIHVDKYVIMPNHIHIILVIDGAAAGRINASPTVSSVIGAYKAGVSRSVGYSVWQRSFYDHIIRNERDYQEIWSYIDQNVLKWQLDKLYHCDGF